MSQQGPLVSVDIGEALEKLVETVGGALGAGYEPKRIQRKAEAEAQALVRMAKAEAQAAIIQAEANIRVRDLESRAEARLKQQELRRQRNIEAVVDKAADQLPQQVSQDPVEQDWVVRFFNYAQDISDEQMQELWAKILAGEVSQPGSFSPFTLHIVHLLGADDARVFDACCQYALRDENSAFIIYTADRSQTEIQRKQRAPLDLSRLQTFGLISSEPTFLPNRSHPLELTTSNGRIYRLKSRVPLGECGGYLFTRSGNELAKLCTAKCDDEYCLALVADWQSAKIEVQEITDEASVEQR